MSFRSKVVTVSKLVFFLDTTSYDYDGILSENGDYTLKYTLLKNLLANYTEPKTKLPDPPELISRTIYENVKLTGFLPVNKIIEKGTFRMNSENLLAMEMLPINNNSGQSYGYIVYRKDSVNLGAFSNLTITGHVCDSVLVMLNGKLISPALHNSSGLDDFGFWRLENSTLSLNNQKPIENATIDLIVENWGRVGYGLLTQYYQYKGLWQGNVLLNNQELFNWLIVPLEFKKSWTNSLDEWIDLDLVEDFEPGLYKGVLTIPDNKTVTDTYLDMRNWKKGIVMVNGFVLGRYARIGPQQCLYVPASFITNGDNNIVIFEHYQATNVLTFTDNQIYETI